MLKHNLPQVSLLTSPAAFLGVLYPITPGFTAGFESQ